MFCVGCGHALGLGVKFCPNCGKPTEISDSSKTGKITINRESKFAGSVISFEVFVDKIKLGSLKSGTSLSTSVELGSHEIIFRCVEKDLVQIVTLNENQKEVTIEIVPKMGWVTAKPSIKSIKYN